MTFGSSFTFQTPNSYFIYTVDDPSGSFAIDRHSGVLKLVKPLDGEKAAEMRLEITTAELEDSLVERKPAGATVTVNIVVKDANDNAPVFVPRELCKILSCCQRKSDNELRRGNIISALLMICNWALPSLVEGERQHTWLSLHHPSNEYAMS